MTISCLPTTIALYDLYLAFLLMPDTYATCATCPTVTKTIETPQPAIRAYLGGSFDPVHGGHIQIAMSVYNSLLPIATEQQRELQVALLPNARSPFKEQSTDPADRLAMLKLAVEDTPLQIDELELWQTPPVYSIDSVRILRQRYPDDCLIFIMGMDSARSLAKWKGGLQLTDYLHLWIFERNQSPQDTAVLKLQLPDELQQQVTESYIELLLTQPSLSNTSSHKSFSPEALKSQQQGRIYIDTRSVITVSSTEIRQQFYKPDFESLPSAKYAVNKRNNLANWLNPKVYQYIITHQLYSVL